VDIFPTIRAYLHTTAWIRTSACNTCLDWRSAWSALARNSASVQQFQAKYSRPRPGAGQVSSFDDDLAALKLCLECSCCAQDYWHIFDATWPHFDASSAESGHQPSASGGTLQFGHLTTGIAMSPKVTNFLAGAGRPWHPGRASASAWGCQPAGHCAGPQTGCAARGYRGGSVGNIAAMCNDGAHGTDSGVKPL